MHPYRVFICYAHTASNRQLAKDVWHYLKDLGADPYSDVNINVCKRWNDDIKAKIAHSHLVVALLTEESSRRPWVNQEIGYAIAMGVPIFQLVLSKKDPEGMSKEFQFVRVDKGLRNLATALSEVTIKEAVEQAKETLKLPSDSFPVTSLCAYQINQRTQILVNYAKRAWDLHREGRVKQLVAFGSFTIPDKHARHPDWDRRDGKQKSPLDLRESLRQEREYMEKHARKAGCDLILDPFVAHLVVEKLGREAALVRLEYLLEFLDSMPDDKVRVAIDHRNIEGSLFAVGDWFAAEAVVPYLGGGYVQTIFTRHAPTVMRLTEDFDLLMKGLLERARGRDVSSRVAAIKTIKRILTTVKRK